ncbi:MAG: phosphodiester glycosidase family protein [Methylocystaceae bacterium]
MTYLYRRIIVWLLAAFIILTYPSAGSAAGPVSKSVKVDGHPVTMVISPLSGTRLAPLLANNRTGQVNDLAVMAKTAGAVTAVNGSFFNAYNPADMVSWGTLVINGELIRRGGSGGALGIAGDGTLQFSRLRTTITGHLDGASKADLKTWQQYMKNWYAWDININIANNPQAIVIFTPRFGQPMKAPVATTITVRQGVIASIQSGPVPIPADGYVIGLGSSCQEILTHFKVGDSCTYTASFADDLGNQLDWTGMQHIIQAGPILVKDGAIALNIKADNMTEPKFYQRSSWSFIAVDKKNNVVLGTVSGVTMSQMAATVQKLGMQNAMALDGNASCALYHQGKYLIKPGRKISNGLALFPR